MAKISDETRKKIANMSQEELNVEKTNKIKEIARKKIENYTAEQVNERLVVADDAKIPFISSESIAEKIINGVCGLVVAIERWTEDPEYITFKNELISTIKPMFLKKFGDKMKDNVLTTEKKRKMLIDALDALDRRVFDVCKWNRDKDGDWTSDYPNVAEELEVEKTLNEKSGYANEEKMSPQIIAVDNQIETMSGYLKKRARLVIEPKKDFKYKGKRYCEIKFGLTKGGWIKPSNVIYWRNIQCWDWDLGFDTEYDKEKWLVSSYKNLSPEEIEALKSYVRGGNWVYRLDRKILQDVINGKTTESPLSTNLAI